MSAEACPGSSSVDRTARCRDRVKPDTLPVLASTARRQPLDLSIPIRPAFHRRRNPHADRHAREREPDVELSAEASRIGRGVASDSPWPSSKRSGPSALVRRASIRSDVIMGKGGNDTSGEDCSLQEVQCRLASDYPGVERERIAELLLACYRRTSAAKRPQYRLILAERDSRVRLRREPRSAGVPRSPTGRTLTTST